MKKILVVQYSQTGQLSKIVNALCRPLIESGETEVAFETLRPEKPYPYPWSFFKFLDVFPSVSHWILRPCRHSRSTALKRLI
ncbi:MAG: hypothetical protein KZQ88_18285 [Candidatus Thiodiazotropha sp. (ex Dulcina madagascariensis)]|nr:hypothetical protein [Candidatus Thiodiazotropha sp. (ex Dulcina madagascariensis)]MCU7928618.1 hypothetical protein [Candidatus Thiodiazotropha sp. (ex Dulcina madagascariensis)]